MNSNYLEKLEFNKIIEQLSNFSITYVGKNMISDLFPSNNSDIVKNLLNETNEAINLLHRNNTPPIVYFNDITIALKTLNASGTLSVKSLLDLASILKQAHNLKEYFNKEYVKKEEYPILTTLFLNLYTNTNIMKIIFDSLIDENTISDNASSKLKSIRKNQKILEQNIKDKLNNILHSTSFSKYIQDSIVTIRNDRYVIPVKEEYRNYIKGFIHDISSTGSTVFIEPSSIFELNNQLNNLKIEENIEIDDILKKLSELFYPYIDNLKNNTDIIGKIDFIFAKAKYSNSIEGVYPKINNKKIIDLKEAKHPLINKETVVPISITLGQNFSCLIITGPNTGGKTVALKTTGLLCLMCCCGLNIPVKDGSSIYVFDNIFADIGDDQSINDSLSTFSSHMKNIVDIIKNATSNSLVLLDELGSGTDPIEGASLAISILQHFYDSGCLTIATTHYQELKKHALINNGFENASVEFDISTLSPTYRLLIGVPGKSNAFEISKKLGLSNNIISNAKSMLNKEDFNFEELLKNIYNDKLQIDKDKLQISEKLKNISKLQTTLEQDKLQIEDKRNSIINTAKIEARNILLKAKDESRIIIKQMKNISSNNELNNLRNKLNNSIKEINISDRKENNYYIQNSLDIKEIKPNIEVFVTTFNQNGTILSNISKSNEVLVQVGNIKTTINIKHLQKAQKTKDNNKFNNISYSNISKSRTISTEINVIGKNVEEAIFIIDKFLDDSSLSKLNIVRIIHGKGTGKLRDGIHTFLKNNIHVKSYRIGSFGEGEMGVTVVELK